MNFYDRISTRTESDSKLRSLRKWIAASQSWLPAPADFKPRYWMPHVSKAREALAALFLVHYLPYWETQEVTQRLGLLAYQHRYEGEWHLVQALLEEPRSTSPETTATEFEEIWLSFQSPDDFFGNFLYLVERLLRLNATSFKYPDNRRRPRRRVRRRGYQDKGSLRPDFTRGRTLPDPEPGEDRRALVAHPLLDYKTDQKRWAIEHIPLPRKEEDPSAEQDSPNRNYPNRADEETSSPIQAERS